jgi:hypothetical protein
MNLTKGKKKGTRMQEKFIVTAFSLYPPEIDAIDQHNIELANPGRSAALRHIIREWAEMRRIKQYRDSASSYQDITQNTPENHQG